MKDEWLKTFGGIIAKMANLSKIKVIKGDKWEDVVSKRNGASFFVNRKVYFTDETVQKRNFENGKYVG